MKKEEFERLLDVCCGALTHEAKKSGFSTSLQFENRVREVLDDLLKDESEIITGTAGTLDGGSINAD